MLQIKKFICRKGLFLVIPFLLFPQLSVAQSLRDLFLTLPEGVTTFSYPEVLFDLPLEKPYREAINEVLKKNKDEDYRNRLSASNQNMDSDFQVTFRNKEMLSIAWQDGTSISAVRLKAPGRGYILMLLQSCTTPFPVSAISFYDQRGDLLSSSDFMPSLSAVDLLTKDLSLQEKTILSTLPLSYRYDIKKKSLEVSSSSSPFLSLEDEAKIGDLLKGRSLLLKWRKGAFHAPKNSFQ